MEHNFNEFMDLLINDNDSKNSLPSYYSDLTEKKEFLWKKLLEYLKQNFKDEGELIYDSDFNSNMNNFFRFLNENIDLDNYNFDDNDKTDLENFWNESVGDLVKYYYQFLQDSQESTENHNDYSVVDGKIPIRSHSFNTEDIKQGDAGNSFDPIPTEEPITIPKWVKPWYNAEWFYNLGFKSYYNVRNNDISPKAISNDKNIQFTRVFNDQMTKWLRLLLPKNSRRVEVEDLNRNFWVASTTLTGVVGYLFDDNSPFQKIIKGALKELLELWENTIYLWGGLAAISQSTGGIKIIMLPIPNSEWQSYNKYDGFKTVVNTQIIIERVKYLTSLYKNYDLIIVPYNRDNNYCKNYYAAQSYPCVVFYNNGTKTFKVTNLRDNFSQPVVFNPANYSDRLFAIKETETYYKYTYPIGGVSTQLGEGEKERYCGGLRILPEITAKINPEGKLQITTFKLKGIDAARQAIRNEEYSIIEYSKISNYVWTEDSEDMPLSKKTGKKDIEGQYDIYRTAVDQALYFCEFPTVSNLTLDRPHFVYDDQVSIIGIGKLIRIGNYMPTKFYSYNRTSYYLNPSYYAEQKVPDASRTTDYLLNLTCTGDKDTQYDIVKGIYNNHLGASNVINSGDCYLYTPKVLGPSNYILECNKIRANDMKASDYLELGYNVISDYIINDTQYDTITYFVAAVGIKPWHNTGQSSQNFQGYWSDTILTHMFRYIPTRLKNYISDIEYANAHKVIKNNGEIGVLQNLGILNKSEKAFNINGVPGFVTPPATRTTWRLPKLIPETTISGYLIYRDTTTNIIYFVNLNASEDLQTAYNNHGIAGVTAKLNGNYQNYIGHSDIMRTDAEIQVELSSPSGVWTVFDGNTDAGIAKNRYLYTEQNEYREVADTEFTFTDSILHFGTAYGRNMNTLNFGSIDGNIILPSTNFQNMNFNW